MEGKIEVDGKIYILTNHAQHRANNRGISLEEIKEALANPKNCRRLYSEMGDSYGVTGRNYVRIILNLEKNVIITVLRINKEYAKSRHKQFRNKRQLINRKKYGNRAKK